jgi:hypothetical protein
MRYVSRSSDRRFFFFLLLVLILLKTAAIPAQSTEEAFTSPSRLLRTLVIRKATEGVPIINAADALGDGATSETAFLFISQSADVIYQNLRPHYMERITSASSNVFAEIVAFRDRLLRRGGSGNACLAGSISYAVHHRLLYELLHVANPNVDLIKDIAARNRISLKDVVQSLSQDARWQNNLQSFNVNQENATAVQGYLEANDDDLGSAGFMSWVQYLSDKKVGMLLLFDRELLAAHDPAAQLFLWSVLVEDQTCLDILIELEERSLGKIFQTFHESDSTGGNSGYRLRNPNPEQTAAFKRDVDELIKEKGDLISARTFKPINGNDVWRSIRRKIYGQDDPQRNLEFHLQGHLKSYFNKNWMKDYKK